MRTGWIVGLALLAGCGSAERDAGQGDHGHERGHRDGGHEHAEGDADRGADGHGHAHGDRAHGDDGATVTHRFEDAEAWAARFEDPERDAWQQPERVLELLALPADGKLVDIGSATGYFPVRFAQAMPQGVVYGVDVEPNLVNYLNLRALREGLPNLVSLVCAYDDPRIPEPVDVIFVCDTYHHIGDRVRYFAKLIPLLRPGGRLVIVDFKQGELPVGPKPGHKLAPEKVRAELSEAGYALASQDELPYQYLLVFTAK